jgi:hypothetical protein
MLKGIITMETTLMASGWVRPQPDSVFGFLILFVLFTLGGLAIWHHRRLFMRGPMATVLFLIAIGYGFALGLWVVDYVGIHEPYGTVPVRQIRRDSQFDQKKPFPTEPSRRNMSPQE